MAPLKRECRVLGVNGEFGGVRAVLWGEGTLHGTIPNIKIAHDPQYTVCYGIRRWPIEGGGVVMLC